MGGRRIPCTLRGARFFEDGGVIFAHLAGNRPGFAIVKNSRKLLWIPIWLAWLKPGLRLGLGTGERRNRCSV
jgi:hypothetical protein